MPKLMECARMRVSKDMKTRFQNAKARMEAQREVDAIHAFCDEVLRDRRMTIDEREGLVLFELRRIVESGRSIPVVVHEALSRALRNLLRERDAQNRTLAPVK